MEHHPLESFINLIEFDRQIAKEATAIALLKHESQQIEEQQKKLAAGLKNAADHVNKAQKSVHEYELTMKELDAAEKEKKKLLEKSESQTVYESLKKEINFLKKSQYDHEKQLVQCWKELEAAQKVFDDNKSKFDKKNEALQKQLQEKSDTISTLQKGIDTFNNERLEKEQSVPGEWLEKYNVMRKQTADPIVPVEFGGCSGCFAQLPPQDLIDLKRKKLIQCSSCYRFLYLPEEPTSHDKKVETTGKDKESRE